MPSLQGPAHEHGGYTRSPRLRPWRRSHERDTERATRNGVPEHTQSKFHPESVAALSDEASQLQDARWFRSGEPFRSMHRNNPWLKPPVGGNGLRAKRALRVP